VKVFSNDPLNLSGLVVEKSPDTLQSLHAVVGIKEVVPLAALELQNVPGVVCVGSVGGDVTLAEREDL
jgi:hypothetical protein